MFGSSTTMRISAVFLIAIFCLSATDIDLYLLLTTDAENRADYNTSAKYNKLLYQKTHKDMFRNNYFEALLRSQQYKTVIKEAKEILQNSNDRLIKRYLILAFLGQKEYDLALITTRELLKQSRMAEDYLLIADIYILNGNYTEALKHSKSAYALNQNAYIIDKIASILSEKQGNNKEAIAYLETHMMLYGANEYLCALLATIYGRNNNINGVLSAYKRIYNGNPDRIVGQKIVELYLIESDYNNLMTWLEKTHFNDDILYDLYKYQQLFIKASELALKLYEQRGDISYLANYAMLQYEAGEQNDSALVDRTVQTLERVIKNSPNHIYLNYLGYLLIDHDKDVKRGIELVKRALIEEPNNLFYTDSLAWGYYRTGQYDEAFKLIKKVKEAIKEPYDPTINEHYELIKKSYEAHTKKQ
ncbi:MAG: hypothetical protein LBN32_03770 [Helicobacteraceae bacterium]|jgi:tetratricopeptide (TPR) repeat protein|nr:hypothetical protein [Helicobacteraceae bacterium]